MSEKPNLFEYATSELSQDAFICWLLAWIEYPQEPHLYQCAKDLIKLFVPLEMEEMMLV